jgi:hypothetical protein
VRSTRGGDENRNPGASYWLYYLLAMFSLNIDLK